MSSQGPLLAGTGADDSAFGSVTWSNPGNITALDNVYATASLSTSTFSHYLKATNFGFSIPVDATIDGIVVEIERKSSVGSAVNDNRIRIVKGGVVGTTDRSAGAAWPTTETIASFGSSSDLWGETWTAADINASNFGVVFAAVGTMAATASVDIKQITVYFTEAPPAVDLNLSLFEIPYYEFFAEDLLYDTNLSLSLQSLPLMELISGYWGQDHTLILPLFEFAYELSTEITWSHDLSCPFLEYPYELFPFSISYSIEVGAVQEQLPYELFSPVLQYDTTLLPSLLELPPYEQLVTVGFSTEVSLGNLLELPPYELAIHSAKVVTPGQSKYLEVTRTACQQVIFGSEPGAFKLNKTASVFRRESPVHLLHLNKVKPTVISLLSLFVLDTPFADLQAGEFLYERTDGYLSITNETEIFGRLVADGDTAAIMINPLAFTLSGMFGSSIVASSFFQNYQ